MKNPTWKYNVSSIKCDQHIIQTKSTQQNNFFASFFCFLPSKSYPEIPEVQAWKMTMFSVFWEILHWCKPSNKLSPCDAERLRTCCWSVVSLRLPKIGFCLVRNICSWNTLFATRSCEECWFRIFENMLYNYNVRCWVGLGGMLTFLALAHMLDVTQDAGLGWGGMLTFLALAQTLDATQIQARP